MNACKRFCLYSCLLLFPALLSGQQHDPILQAFYWNTHPGDLSNGFSGGIWWDSLKGKAHDLSGAGFDMLWIPPPFKGASGRHDMGYGMYDYYDTGNQNQKGSIRTRFGNAAQLNAMIDSLKAAGLDIMVDAVVNHRGGADATQGQECNDPLQPDDWTIFSPNSIRFPGDRSHFHPNNQHCDLTAPYHNVLVFQDVCYFNQEDAVHPGGWYYGPHNLGAVGDSMISWGRWMVQEKGFDALRIDAAKHVEEGFMAPFLVELKNGAQPFALAEFFDGDMNYAKSWHDAVEGFITNSGTGNKNANIAMFDFNLRFALRDMCNDASGNFSVWDLNSRGFRFHTSPLDAEDIVTFIESHDTDRTGIREVPCPGGDFQYANLCFEYFQDIGHDPVLSDKHMAYAYLMAAEGRPTVFWRDYYDYGLEDEIKWLMALRKQAGYGSSVPISALNPFFGAGWHGGDIFVLRRNGNGPQESASMFILNDRSSGSGVGDVWVDSPFGDMELKDYSDAFMFQTNRAFGDSRTNLKAGSRNYAWYMPTGLYPKPPGEKAGSFSIKQGTAGAKLHYVVLRAADMASFLVNGSPLQAGDEIAIHASSQDPNEVAGIGRIGQGARWDGVHDMLIEVLGGSNAAEAKGGLLSGDTLRLIVKDGGSGAYFESAGVTLAANSTGFTFVALRPGSRGGAFPLTVNHDQPTYTTDAISLITAFNADIPFGPSCKKDGYEPNDDLSTSANLYDGVFSATGNTRICPSGDMDWFSFSLSQNRTVLVRLEDLPADFDVDVYDGNGLLLANGNNTGLTNESVQLPNAQSGNYFVRVSGKAGYWHPDHAYNLIVSTQKPAPAGIGIKPAIQAPILRSKVPTLDVFPNPAREELGIYINDLSGQNLMLELMGPNGKKHLSKIVPVIDGSLTFEMKTEALGPGIYFLRLAGEGILLSKKVVILDH